MKIKIRYIVIAVILASVILNITVVLTNNRVADTMKTLLREYPLPPETELLDSLTVLQRINCNGNGMHYYGIILVQSGLTAEELEEHYDGIRDIPQNIPVFGQTESIDVSRQESPVVFAYHDYVFDNYREDADCYRIMLSIETSVGCEETLWESILNTDWRGH